MNNILQITLFSIVFFILQVHAGEEPAPFDHPYYSQKDLIKARLQYGTPLEDQYLRYLATLKNNDGVVITPIGDGKRVVLSFKNFNRFIHDEKILHLANAYTQEQLHKPSCPAEAALIQQYTANYISAIEHYERLIYRIDYQGKYVKKDMALKNAFLDAIEANVAQSLPWGLRWLAAFWVENNIKGYTFFKKNPDITSVVKNHLAAMIGKANVEYDFIDTKHLNPNAHQAVILNRNTPWREDTPKQLSAGEIAQELEQNKGLQLNEEELNQACKYHYSMEWHKQKPVDYKLYNQNPEYRKKFCQKLWSIIEDETGLKRYKITQLRYENPVDKNSETNKFVGLFDRIAKK
ncbi:MAG: hypothetical protein Q8Q60_01065 [Candidatus Chromulinivorax sp.]|nr:hypothetical protein [Candidatus Chromulinivorax sp.]